MRAGRAGAGRADNSKNYVVYGSLSGTTTTLTLNTALGPDATQANVDFTVSAGRNTVVQVNAGQAWAGTTTVNSGAFTTANGITLASSAIVVGGGTVDLAAGATLTAGGANTNTTCAGGFTGAGALAKVGAGTLTVSGSSGMTGPVDVSAGTVRISGDGAPGGSPAGLGSGTVSIASGAQVTYWLDTAAGDTIANPFVISGGTLHTEDGGNIFNGRITMGAGYRFTKTGTGTLLLPGSNGSLAGQVQVAGGRLEIGPTGSINASSAVSVSNGAELKYSSATPLSTVVSLGQGALSGTGSIDTQLFLSSTTTVVSPGTSPGIMPFGTSQSWSAFTSVWELDDFTTGTAAGVNFDQIAITGSLGLTGNQYVLDITSLTAGTVPGDVGNFSNVSRSWTILTTTGGITGFDASEWTLSSADFTTGGAFTGTWTLAQQGNDLGLTAVPKPSALVLAAIGVALVISRRRVFSSRMRGDFRPDHSGASRLGRLAAALCLVVMAMPVQAESTWTSNPADQGVLVAILGTGSNWTTSQPLRDGDMIRITGTWGGANMGSANTYYYAVGDGSTSGTFSRFSQAPGATTFTPSAAQNNPVPSIKVPTWYTAGNWVGGVPNGVGANATIATNTSTWAIAIDRNVTVGSLTVDTSVVSSITNVSGTTTFPFTQSGLALLATSRNAGPVSSLTFATAAGTPTVTVFGGNSFSFSENVLTGATPGNSSSKLLIEGTQGLVIDNQNPVQAPIVITTGTVYAPGAVRFGFGLDWTRFSGDLTLEKGVFQPLAGGSLNNNLSSLPLRSKVILGTGTNIARIDIVNSSSRPVIRGLESTSPNASIVNTTGTNSEAIEVGSYGEASDVFTFAGNIGATGTTASNAVRFFKDGPGTQYLTGTNQMDGFVANTVLVGVNGGKLSLGTTGQMGAVVGGVYTTNTNAAFAIKNGEFAISGMGVAAPRAQTYSGALLFGVIAANSTAVDANQTSRSSGLNTFTVEADPAQPATLTFGSVRNRSFLTVSSTTPNLNGATMLYRGTNLGSGTGVAGVASIVFTTAPTTGTAGYLNAVSGSTAALGTPQAPVLKAALADTSATGNGAGFATYQASTGVRLLNPTTEQTAGASGAAYNSASVNDNIRLTLAADEAITGHSSNTLQIANSSGSSRTVTNAGSGLYAANGLLFSGTSPIVLTGGGITGVAGTNGEDVVIHSINTGGVTIQTPVTNTGTNTPSRPGWIVYNGPGNIRLEGAQTLGQAAVSGTFFGGIAFNGTGTTTIAATIVSGSFVYVNKGLVKLDTGASWTNTPRLQVAGGATFDLNGITATDTTNRFSDIAPDWQVSGAAAGYMPVGGAVTNSGSTTVDLVLAGAGGAASQPFYGVISGNLNLVVDKGASNTQSLGNANTYTGNTFIRSGVLNIARGGNLPATTVVTLGSLTSATTATLTMGDSNGSTNGPARMEIAGLYNVGSGTNSVQNQGANIGQLTLNIPAGTDNVYSGNLGVAIVTTGSTQNLFGLRKIGSGTFEPSGAIVNYSGGTVIEGGVFRISSDSKLGQIGSLTGTAGSPGSPLAPISAFENSLVLNGGALQVTTSTNFVLDAKRGIGLGPTSGETGGSGTLVVDPTIKLTYAGIIATAGNTGTQLLIKQGLGELALDGTSTFTGTTQVAAGTLSGTGSIASSLTVASGAVVAPAGGSIGTFTVGGAATIAGTLRIGVDAGGTGGADVLAVGGLLDLSAGTAAVDFSALATLDDEAYVFATYGTRAGTFGSIMNLPAGYGIDYAYLGNSIAITTAVPEPMTSGLLTAGAAGWLAFRRMRRARVQRAGR